MTCYNHEQFVNQAIDSCLNQTYKNIEIIIADDCSQDQSAKIIEDYRKNNHERIFFLENQVNLGVTPNLNKALLKCKGKYIVFISADDVFSLEKIAIQVAYMEKNMDVCVSYHDVVVFQSQSSKVLYKISDRYKPLFGNAELVISKRMFFSCLGCMVRSSAVPVNGYDSAISLCSDWVFMAEALIQSRGKIAYIPGEYAYHRRHNNNITDQYMNKLIDEEMKAIQHLKIKYPDLSFYMEEKVALLKCMSIIKLLSRGCVYEALSVARTFSKKIYVLKECSNIIRDELLWRLKKKQYSGKKIEAFFS